MDAAFHLMKVGSGNLVHIYFVFGRGWLHTDMHAHLLAVANAMH